MSIDQQFCLRWNEHTGTMVKVFKQMFETQAFVDCTLACEGEIIKAHKMILAACSPYLHTILEENTSKHPIIFLPHLKYTDIKALVDYMYCGEVYINFGHLPSLLKAAEVLRIKGLTDDLTTTTTTTSTHTQSSNAATTNCNDNNNSIMNSISSNNNNNNRMINNNNKSIDNICNNSDLIFSNIDHMNDCNDNSPILNNCNVNNNNNNNNNNCNDNSITNNNNNCNDTLMIKQDFGNDEENGLEFEPEMSFVDDNSNEDQNNEDESSNGGEHQNKTFLCHLCRCSFTAQSSLRRHMHRHYTDRERFECEICHNSYSRKDYLKEHKKTKHRISL